MFEIHVDSGYFAFEGNLFLECSLSSFLIA